MPNGHAEVEKEYENSRAPISKIVTICSVFYCYLFLLCNCDKTGSKFKVFFTHSATLFSQLPLQLSLNCLHSQLILTYAPSLYIAVFGLVGNQKNIILF